MAGSGQVDNDIFPQRNISCLTFMQHTFSECLLCPQVSGGGGGYTMKLPIE